MVIENQRWVFYVTHVEADGKALKIWAQTDEKVVCLINSALESFKDKLESYEPTNNLSPSSIIPNTRCCARGINNAFQRAKILSLRSDGMVQVQFIDYGNISYVSIHNINLLSDAPDARYLFSIPEAASVFVLADVKPIGTSWFDDVVKHIRAILINTEHYGVCKTINNVRMIKLKVMNEDFSQVLISRNMAYFSPSCPSSLQPASHIQPANNTPQNWRASVQAQNSITSQKMKSFKAVRLEVDSMHEVRISHVEEGPCKFSIQLIETIPYLEQMMQKLNSLPPTPLQEPPIAGTVCLAQPTRTNELRRVILNSPGNNSVRVYYADYGSHEVLPFTSIYQIPDEFVVPDIFSIIFTLNGINDWKICPEMKEYFLGLVHNNVLKLRVCKGKMSPLTQYCDLFLQGKSVKDILAENFPDCVSQFYDFVYQEPKSLQSGRKDVAIVSYVESITKFFVQIENDLKFLDDIMEKIDKHSKTASRLTLAQTHQNMPCIALYEVDGKWYRASIVNSIPDKNTVKVFYVDFGNEEIVSIDNLRAIPVDLVASLPKLAIRCKLNGFESKSMDKELNRVFESLVLEERVGLTILNYTDNTAIVDLSDSKNIANPIEGDIAERLKKALEISHKQESKSLPQQTKNQKSDAKISNSLVQRQRPKNKNIKLRENWNSGRERDSNHGQSQDKFRKDNENAQRYDRFHSNTAQSNRFEKDSSRPERTGQNSRFGRSNDFQPRSVSEDHSNNDRFSKGSLRNNVHESNDFGKVSKEHQTGRSMNSRIDRSFGSDRDSDTSSRGSGGGKRFNQGGRKTGDDHLKRNSPPNQSKIGHWNNEQHDNRKNYNGDVSSNFSKSRSPKDSDDSRFSKTKSEEAEKLHSQTSSNKETVQSSSTSISEIPPANITVGAIKNCIMVFFINPCDFYVQLCPDNDDLYKMMNKIDSVYKNGGKVLQSSIMKVGLQCMAQYSDDEQWYRAVIKSVENSSVTVFFVDYGNMETISYDKIKEIQSDFTKLPAQAIRCKLFCASKTNWSKEDSDMLANEVDNQLLEAEFVAKEEEMYSILLKKAPSDNQDTNKYINESFSGGIDVIKERDVLRNKSKITPVDNKLSTLAFASLNAKWSDCVIEFGKKYEVRLGWFVHPSSFYCQFESLQNDFKDMMNEMQIVYENYKPVSEPLKVGSSVVALLPEDGVLYRAQVLGLNEGRVEVQYIDYGDKNIIDPQGIYPVEEKLMKLPKLGIYCGLKDVAPLSGSDWPTIPEFNNLFGAEKYECIFHEINEDKYLISLENNGNDIARTLVESNFATCPSLKVEEEANVNEIQKEKIPRININLLEGQTLKVKVSSVEGVSKFYVQFYTAGVNEAIIESFISENDPEVMPRLSCHEICLGAGCLVNYSGKWRRGVVVKFTKENSKVKFIDTGEHQIISLNSMLKLPGELSVMQNQAIECNLFDVPLSTKADEMIKKTITGKDVKIFIEKVENNRLTVRLFDMNGNKIKVIDSQNTEKINPICNLPILSSTHDVIATWMNSSNSIWLQQKSMVMLEEELLQGLYDHYSNIENSVIPVENELYVALSADGNWYRVKVNKVQDQEAVVTLLDYGNIENIPFKNFRTLELQFYSPHQLAVEVSLSVSVKGDSAEQIEILEPFFKDKEIVATFYNIHRKWIVDLNMDGEKLNEKLKDLNVVKEIVEPELKDKQLDEMQLGGKYDVYVTHVDSPSQLWVHRKEEKEPLMLLQNQIQNESSQCEDWQDIPEEKSLCLAIYTLDNAWYRAEVLDADADITTVRFIDYGNTDVIDNSVHRIKYLPEKWKVLKRYAVPCKLPIIPKNTDDWSGEACKRLADLVVNDNPVQAIISADKTPMHIDLLINDKSVCKTLIEEQLAEYAKSHEELEEQIIEEVPLDPRSAFVSHVISVDQFWMQEEKSVIYLEMMEDRLVMASMLKPLAEIKEGIACIAHFHEDNKYYRATIISHDENGTQVRYTDYGNSAYSKDLKAIPDDLVAVDPMSKKCCLAKPEGVTEWPKNVDVEFFKLAGHGATVFLLDVLQEAEPCLVRLTYHSEDVATKLISLCAKDAETNVTSNANQDSKDIVTTERPSPLGEENSLNVNVKESSESYILEKNLNFNLEVGIKELSITNDKENMVEIIRDTENYDLKCDDLSYEKMLIKEKLSSSEVINLEETVNSEISKQDDKADISTEDQLIEKIMSTDTATDSEKFSTDQESKIVPGCVSRGISVEEIARYSPVHQILTTEEKIVPGSINKGQVFSETVTSDDNDEVNKNDISSSQCSGTFEVSQTSNVSSPIHHDERIVPSCISRGETPIHFERPTTPKIMHDEKLVAGAVNLPNEQDEIISIEVNQGIPES